MNPAPLAQFQGEEAPEDERRAPRRRTQC